MLFVPARISEKYVEFFIVNEPDYLRQSFMRYFGLKSPYDEPIGNLLGYLYTGTKTNWCNGIIGDAFANWGVMGLFIYPILLTFCFNIYDVCSLNVDKKICFVTSIFFYSALSNGFIFQVLLTQGFIVTCIIFLFISPWKKVNYEKNNI